MQGGLNSISMANEKRAEGSLRPDDMIEFGRYFMSADEDGTIAVLTKFTDWFEDSWFSFGELGAAYAKRGQDGDKALAIAALELSHRASWRLESRCLTMQI